MVLTSVLPDYPVFPGFSVLAIMFCTPLRKDTHLSFAILCHNARAGYNSRRESILLGARGTYFLKALSLSVTLLFGFSESSLDK